MSTAPYILIIPVWFLKEIVKKQVSIKWWLLFSEFCYELLGFTFSYYLLFSWLFQAVEFWWPLYAVASTALSIPIILVAIYTYSLKYRSVVDYYKSLKWTLLRLLFLIIAVIFIASVFVILPIPIQQDPPNSL